MKTRNLFFALVAMLITSAVFATETPKLQLSAKGNGKLLVSLEGQNALPIEVTISDQDGSLAYTWKSENPEQSMKKLFNLAGLEKGFYNLSVKYGKQSLNTSLDLNDEKIGVGPTVVIAEPFFNYRNNMLYITYLNPTKNNVYVNIYKNGAHYTGFYLGKNFDLQKCIDFKTADRGTYNIVLTAYDNSHFFTLTR